MPWRLLPFAMQDQTETNWCWAAVAASVAAFFRPATPWTQCSIADAQLGLTDCCGAGSSGPCNVYGYLASSLNRVGHLDRWRVGRVALLREVQEEIDEKRPLCARVAYRKGGAHFVAIIGYLPESEQLAGSQLVAVEDPLWGDWDVPYDILCAGHLNGRWRDSYFTQGGARRNDRGLA